MSTNDQEKYEKIKNLREKGHTYDEITELLHSSKSTISKALGIDNIEKIDTLDWKSEISQELELIKRNLVG